MHFNELNRAIPRYAPSPWGREARGIADQAHIYIYVCVYIYMYIYIYIYMYVWGPGPSSPGGTGEGGPAQTQDSDRRDVGGVGLPSPRFWKPPRLPCGRWELENRLVVIINSLISIRAIHV